MTYHQYLDKLESTLQLYFGQKAPAMPESIKQSLVKYTPYITIIFIIVGSLSVLPFLGLSTLMLPLTVISGGSVGYLIMVLSLITIIMEIVALPSLFKKEMKGWRIMFYISLIHIVQNILSSNISGLIISSVLSFYFLFQVKSYYK